MNRRLAGRKAKLSGDLFEVWVEHQFAQACRLGLLAHWYHNQPTARLLGGRLVYTGAGVSDYTGCLEGGRSVACEAKSTADRRLLKTAVAPLQQRHLEAVSNAGGLALLLVEYRDGLARTRFAVPWARIKWSVARTAEGVAAEDIDPVYEVKDGECFLTRFCER